MRPVDERAARRIRRRLQAAAVPPWLHAEVARRMAERLAIVKLQPRRLLDWWSHLGASRTLLREHYRDAEVVAVESETAAPQPASQRAAWWSPGRWRKPSRQAIDETAVEPGAAQLVWANMGLHGEPDPLAAMRRWHRALAVDGFLMFSTLGPGTLPELRELYRAHRWPSPFAPFVDMHDLGDMLIEAGFADPVMDQEQITLHWSTADALLAELHALGGNADPARHAGLRTPRWRARLLEAIARSAGAHGRPSMTFEIVYGHAVRAAPRAAVQSETSIALSDMREMVSARRRTGAGGGGR